MLLKGLPEALIAATRKVMETGPMEECPSCGAVMGSCPHTEGISEDSISALAIPGENEPQQELSGEQDEVIINPEYSQRQGVRDRTPY